MTDFFKNMFGWLRGERPMPEIKDISNWETSKHTTFTDLKFTDWDTSKDEVPNKIITLSSANDQIINDMKQS